MGGFLSSIFTGNSPGLSTAQGNLGSLAGYTGNTGQKATNAATGYDLGILSGDPTQTAMTLAPEISANQQQANQQKQTLAQFGTRSGGNTATANNIDTQSRANLIDLIGRLRSGAAGQLGQIGLTSTGQGITSNMDAGQLANQELQNKLNSILGKGVSSLVGGFTAPIAAAGI